MCHVLWQSTNNWMLIRMNANDQLEFEFQMELHSDSLVWHIPFASAGRRHVRGLIGRARLRPVCVCSTLKSICSGVVINTLENDSFRPKLDCERARFIWLLTCFYQAFAIIQVQKKPNKTIADNVLNRQLGYILINHVMLISICAQKGSRGCKTAVLIIGVSYVTSDRNISRHTKTVDASSSIAMILIGMTNKVSMQAIIAPWFTFLLLLLLFCFFKLYLLVM